jgi:UDP-glucose 4-epimerase
MMITGECVATDLAAVSLRYFNVAGAALGAGERHQVETHLIPNALDAVAGSKPPLTMFGDDWPTPGRHPHPRLRPRLGPGPGARPSVDRGHPG